MRRNVLNKLEMYPLPPVTPGKVCVIGEAPNYTELQKGKYFISDGAKVLKATMDLADLDPNDCYYTVAVTYMLGKTKDLPTAMLEKQRARLIDEIKTCGAKVVMPLGGFASQILLGLKSVTMLKILGNVMSLPELPGVTIIPNYHPAALKHNAAGYKIFSQVISGVSRVAHGESLTPGEIHYTEILPAEIPEFIQHLNTLDIVGADFEASSLNRKRALPWVLGIATSSNEVRVLSRETMLAIDMNELFDTKCKWVWHHGKFDTEMAHEKGWTKARLDEDTILEHYCINETSGTHGLGMLATLYLGADEYKSKMNSEFNVIVDIPAYLSHKEDLIERVAIDAAYTYQLHHIFNPRIKKNPDWNNLYYTTLLPAARFLRRVQMSGAKVDAKYLKSRIPMYETEIEHRQQAIVSAAAPFWNPKLYMVEMGAKSASKEFKPTSPKQLAWLLYKQLGLKPDLARPTYSKSTHLFSTDAEHLEAIPNPPEFLKLLLELRSLKKQYKTYCLSYLECMDENDIVHATFNEHITATGRLSCTDPNLQNVPSDRPDLRRAFIPRGKDRVLMEVDFSGAELRVLAFLSKDAALIKAVTEGDLHSEVAEVIFGPDFTKLQRGMAKTVNFGIIYGRTGASIDAAFNLPAGEGDNMIKVWSEMYPDAWAYLESCAADVRAGRPLKTPYGRWRRFGLITPQELDGMTNEAKNFRVQSISTDNTLHAAMDAEETLLQHDCYIINLIHDSILIDTPVSEVQEMSKYMSSVMEGAPKKYLNCDVKFHCDTDLGMNWGDFHAYDNQTNLVEVKTSEGKIEVPLEQWYKEQQKGA